MPPGDNVLTGERASSGDGIGCRIDRPDDSQRIRWRCGLCTGRQVLMVKLGCMAE